MSKFKIVAHRGYAANYPENTMAAMQAAVDKGVKLLELDVQLTRDQVPIVFHDDTLIRTAGIDGCVMDMDWSELSKVSAHEPERLGSRFEGEPIPTLEVFLNWLEKNTSLHAFVEIKDESLVRYGYEAMFKQLVPLCNATKDQITIIGYDLKFLVSAREHGLSRIGWVVTSYDENEKAQAESHQPDYIICNFKKVNTALWQGNWQWMFYEVTTADLARKLVKDGASYIETMELEALISGLNPEEWSD